MTTHKQKKLRDILKPPIVVVLGAGFTKSFDADAPLLQFNIQLPFLKKKYKRNPNIYSFLKTIRTDKSGCVNIENLLSRLSTGMPYDYEVFEAYEREALYYDVLYLFYTKIVHLEPNGKPENDILRKFTKFLIDNDVNTITFNYDDLLDKSLFIETPDLKKWTPDNRYGFDLQQGDTKWGTARSPMNRLSLFKMHGSINWFATFGAPKPYTFDSLFHLETWYPKCPEECFPPLKLQERFESLPFIIPPLLDKKTLYEYPVLRLIWKKAYNVLNKAATVIFLGYSLPKTDLAATFLFSEAIGRKNFSNIIIVNRIDNRKPETKQVEDVKTCKEKPFRDIFPRLTSAHFPYGGVLEWIKNNC